MYPFPRNQFVETIATVKKKFGRSFVETKI